MVHISLMPENQLEDGLDSYFDINRRMRLAEKFNEERSTALLDEVIDLMIQISGQFDATTCL